MASAMQSTVSRKIKGLTLHQAHKRLKTHLGFDESAVLQVLRDGMLTAYVDVKICSLIRYNIPPKYWEMFSDRDMRLYKTVNSRRTTHSLQINAGAVLQPLVEECALAAREACHLASGQAKGDTLVAKAAMGDWINRYVPTLSSGEPRRAESWLEVHNSALHYILNIQKISNENLMVCVDLADLEELIKDNVIEKGGEVNQGGNPGFQHWDKVWVAAFSVLTKNQEINNNDSNKIIIGKIQKILQEDNIKSVKDDTIERKLKQFFKFLRSRGDF